MAADFWPDNALEIEQLIAEVRAARGSVLLPAQRDPDRNVRTPDEAIRDRFGNR